MVHPTSRRNVNSTDNQNVAALNITWPDPPEFALVIDTPRIYFAGLKNRIHSSPNLTSEARRLPCRNLAFELLIAGPGNADDF